MIRPLATCTSVLILAVASLVAPPASAQEYGRPRQPEVRREGVQCTGTVKQVSGGVVQMVTPEGEQWLVKLESRPQEVSYTASGDTSIVKPGMFVMFNTRLRRKEATEPITNLTIFTPRQGYPVGIAPEGSFSVAGPKASDGLFANEKEETARPKPMPVKEDENTVYRVAGQVSKISRLGELTINAGGTPIKADMDENAKVSVSMGDLSWLKAGDNIEFRGWYAQGQKGQAWANQVTASAPEPLKDESKKKKPLPASTSAENPAGQDAPAKPAEGEKKPEAEKKAE